MTLRLTIDGERWRQHLRSVVDAQPDLVPVAKGNGYGCGLGRLARKSQWLGVDTMAVGTYHEISAVEQRFDGSILVLTPWRPFGVAAEMKPDKRIIHTVGRLSDLDALLARDPDARYVIELATSMQRHGFATSEVADVAERTQRGTCEGVAVHLPLADGTHLAQTVRLLAAADALPMHRIWVSHLSDDEMTALRQAYPQSRVRPRVGTALWLGDRAALRASGTVLDVRPTQRGEPYGYRSRKSNGATLLVVGGGTAHGVGLSAPNGDQSPKAKAKSLARGGLDAAGVVKSPYFLGGKQLRFAEPPHMQASMLLVPDGVKAPAVGDELALQVRFTTTTFDEVVIT